MPDLEQVAPLEGLNVFVDASPGFLGAGADLRHLLSRWGANVTSDIAPHGVIVGLRAGRPRLAAPFPFWRNRLLARILASQLQLPHTLGCTWVASATSVQVHGVDASMIAPIARGLCLWHGLYRPATLEHIEKALADHYPSDAPDSESGDELSRILAEAADSLDTAWFKLVGEAESSSGEVWADWQPAAGIWPIGDSAEESSGRQPTSPAAVPDALAGDHPAVDLSATYHTLGAQPEQPSAEAQEPLEEAAAPGPGASVPQPTEGKPDGWDDVPGLHSYRSREYHPYPDGLPTTPIGSLPRWAENSLMEVLSEVLQELPEDTSLGDLLASAVDPQDPPAAEVVVDPPQFYPLSFRPRHHGWMRTGPDERY